MLPAITRPLLALLTTFVVLLPAALANVEKTVFVAPSAIAVPNVRPGLQDLRLTSLSPSAHVLRTNIPVAFPSDASPRGLDSWYLLSELTPGQRYEVRVCWAATQPTSFWLEAHSISHVFETPELITALASFSESIPDSKPIVDARKATDPPETSASLLFLRIQAAADFYSLNKTRMSNPPDVKVDIILDPFILNAVPRSLIPTGLYIIALAVGAWFLSSFIVNWASAIEPILLPLVHHRAIMARVVDPSLVALPTELILLIIKYLEPASIINFAFAAYPALQAKMIVPPMTWRVYAPLCRGLELPSPQRGPLAIFGAWPLPTELTLQVLSGLGPEDLMRFVFGHYHLVPSLLPDITPDTNKQLTKAWLQVEMMVRELTRDECLSWTASLNRRDRSWSI